MTANTLEPSALEPSALEPSPLEHGRVAAEPPEVVVVHEHRVWCDGQGGPLGHPRVYLEMGPNGSVDCAYCDRRFVLAPHSHPENVEFDPADDQGGTLK